MRGLAEPEEDATAAQVRFLRRDLRGAGVGADGARARPWLGRFRINSRRRNTRVERAHARHIFRFRTFPRFASPEKKSERRRIVFTERGRNAYGYHFA